MNDIDTHGQRLLVLDDEPAICTLLTEVATRRGFKADSTSDRATFIAAYSRLHPHAIVLDLHLGESDGIEVLTWLTEQHCDASILLVSGQDQRTLEAAQRVGLAHGLRMIGSIAKPFTVPELECAFEKLVGSERSLCERELADGIERGELVLHYQPKLDIRTGVLAGCEVLVRWQHPRLGLLPPARFLPMASSAGLMRPLTYSVLSAAIEQGRQWNARGLGLSVAVNFAADMLADTDLIARIEEELTRSGLPAGRLVVEITESTAMSDPLRAMEVLTRLRIRGVEISLDDFGIGFSSLQELQRMPVSEIKIDRSFVGEALTQHGASAIVRAVIGLGHELGLRVVAEGVENVGTWGLLRSLGCDQAQGYHISHPLPVAALEYWLADRQRPATAMAV